MAKTEKPAAPLKGRAARKARKAARAGMPKRSTQIIEAFQLTRGRDKRFLPYLLLAFFGTLIVIELVGALLNSNYVITTIFGVLSAVLVAFIVFGQRAQRSALGEIEGQPGAAAAIVTNMRGDWRVTPNVAANRTMDVVHRVVGKPGVILIGEGSSDRLAPLLADQRKRVQRVASGTPIAIIIVGVEPGQVRLRKLQRALTKLPRTFKGSTVDEIEGRMRALGAFAVPIPKGPMPKGLRIPKGVNPPR
jgi:Domain of unknown function (DUF4191)